MLEELRRSLVDLDRERFLQLLNDALNSGVDPEVIAFKAMSEAMEEIGRLFESGDYFLADLLYAAEIFKEAMRVLEPRLKMRYGSGRNRGTMVIGTVKGDIHDIGKSLVASLLEFRGFKVVDLGVDVPPEKFVDAIKVHKPDIVGISALLTTGIPEVEETIKTIEREGLRGRVKIVVGGAALSQEVAERIGADYYAKNAIEAVRIAEEVASGRDRGHGSSRVDDMADNWKVQP